MRTIKFRGKTADGNEWVYGDLEQGDDFLQIITSCTPSRRRISYLVDPETVGQFTGLHDFNGKEIYEGDIIQSIKNPNIKHHIRYDEKDACFHAVMSEFIDSHVYQAWLNDFPKVVIGNMTDNPNFLKGGDE